MWQAAAAKAASYVLQRSKQSKNWRNFLGFLLLIIFLPILAIVVLAAILIGMVAELNNAIISFLFGGISLPSFMPTNAVTYYEEVNEQLNLLDEEWALIISGEDASDSDDDDGGESDTDEDSDEDGSEDEEDESEDDEEDSEDGETDDDTDDLTDSDTISYADLTDLDERELLMKVSFFTAICNGEHISADSYHDFAQAFADGGNVSEMYAYLEDSVGISFTNDEKEDVITAWNNSYGEAISREDEGDALDWGGWNGTSHVKTYHYEDGEIGQAVVDYAMDRLGDPYSAALRGQFDYVDCSYLTMWAYAQVGIEIPATEGPQAQTIYENGGEISEDELQPGDLIFWSYKPWYSFRSITHTGIYAGDGYVIHASSSKRKVVCVPIFDKDKIKMYGRPY